MNQMEEMGARRFGRVNWLGLYTLSGREVQRFTSVWSQTVLGPLFTAGLFLAVFSVAIGSGRSDVMGAPFLHFLAPGILMMTVVQNAFANTSSSVLISKVQGNIVDTLMPPLSPLELMIGYVVGGVMRGLALALVFGAVIFFGLGIGVAHPLWALTFVILAGIFMGGVGLVAGIYANRFDQMAAITNFIVTPLSFLSGTFYSIQNLPPAMKGFLHINPVFYMIDGLRYGVIGQSDSDPLTGLVICIMASLAALGGAWMMFRSGYRLKA